MKLENLKYQISLFGNYEEIVPNIETIKQFVELFTDEKLIPNQFKEFNLDLKEEMSRLSLTSIDNSFTINFNSDRIDFILTNINLGVFSMLDFSTFINNIKNYVLKIDSVSKKKHKRIGLIRDVLVSEIDTDSLQRKFNNNIIFFNDKKKNEWSNSNASRFEKEDEIFNVISNIRTLKTRMLMLNDHKIFEGLLINLDVNTIVENQNYRFNSENFNQNIDNISMISDEIYNQTYEFLK